MIQLRDCYDFCCNFVCWQAEQALTSGNLDKEYAPIGGTPEFCLESAKLAFGDNSPVIKDGRVSVIWIILNRSSSNACYK